MGGGFLGSLLVTGLFVKHPALARHLFGNNIIKVFFGFFQDMQALPAVTFGLFAFTAYAAKQAFLSPQPYTSSDLTASHSVKQVLWLSLFALVPLSIAAVILSGNYAPDGSLSCWRYLIPLYLFPLYGGVMLAFDKVMVPLWRHHTLSKIALAVVAASTFILLPWPKQELAALDRIVPSVVSCVDKYADEYKLHRGLASSYWAAKLMREYLPERDIQLMALRSVSDKPYETFWWINNLQWYNQPMDFIYFTDQAKEQWPLDLAKVEAEFGPPEAKLTCPENAQIWTYTNNVKFRDQFKNHPKVSKTKPVPAL